MRTASRASARRLLPAIALAFVAVTVACGGGGNSMGQIDFPGMPEDSVAGISMVAPGETVVWFVAGGDLVPVDARTREVGEAIPMPDGIAGMTTEGDDVWLALEDETLRRYDHETSTLGEPNDYIPDDYDYVSLRDLSMAVVDGAVWIELVARLVAIDIETGELRANIPYDDLIAIAGGDDEVWVGVAGTLQRIDASTGEVTDEIKLGGRSGGVAAGEGLVWITTDLGLQRIDASSLEAAGEPFTYEEREDPSRLVATPYGLWGVLHLKNEVVKVDTSTGKLTERYTLKSPYSSHTAELGTIAYGADALWVGTAIGNRAGFLLLKE